MMELKRNFDYYFQELTLLWSQRSKMHLYGNSLLMLNPLYMQCPLCGNAIALRHLNKIFIKDDKLMQHLSSIHFQRTNVSVRGENCFNDWKTFQDEK